MSDASAAPNPDHRSYLREQSKALLERLVQAYPAAFQPFSERNVKPLKLGIHKDLIPIIKEWGYEVAVLKYTLGSYTRRLCYQIALLKNSQRINLEGEPAGDISQAHRQTAQEKIKLIKEKRRQNQNAGVSQAKQNRPRTAKPRKGVSSEAVAALQEKLNRKAAY